MTESRAFTVMEVLIVIVIIAILGTLTIPVLAKLRSRAQRVQCTANLKSLHLATQLYIQEHNQWPQVRLSAQNDSAWEDFAQRWITELQSYGPTARTWICPTSQANAGDPDYMQAGNERVDYIGTPFDDKPTTPGTIGRVVPWFSEAEDVHGNGNLVIFADGSVSDLKTAAAKASSSAPK